MSPWIQISAESFVPRENVKSIYVYAGERPIVQVTMARGEDRYLLEGEYARKLIAETEESR